MELMVTDMTQGYGTPIKVWPILQVQYTGWWRFGETKGLWQYKTSETHLKLKSRHISFAHDLAYSCPVALQFCTEHSCITALSSSLHNSKMIWQMKWVYGVKKV